MFLTDDAGDELWDFHSEPTLALFGSTGSGKTTMARHVALSWIEEHEGTVIVGAHHSEEWDDLSGILHVSSLKAAVDYATLLSETGAVNSKALMVILDDVDRLPLDQFEAVKELRDHEHICWTFTGHQPLYTEGEDGQRSSMAMGILQKSTMTGVFGEDDTVPNAPLGLPRGTVVRYYRHRGLQVAQLPGDLLAELPYRIADAAPKAPLPKLPKRHWYAPSKGIL